MKRTKKTDRPTGTAARNARTSRTSRAARTRLNTLTDKEIIRRGDGVVRSRHELAIELLDCLIEIDRRSLHVKKGYSSLFYFCTRRWHFSPAKAGRFIASMRCIRKFPDVRVLLEDRKLSICGIAAIARLVTEENHDKLLRDVSGKPTRRSRGS